MTGSRGDDEFADPVFRDPTAAGDYYGDGSSPAPPVTPAVPPPVAPPVPPPAETPPVEPVGPPPAEPAAYEPAEVPPVEPAAYEPPPATYQPPPSAARPAARESGTSGSWQAGPVSATWSTTSSSGTAAPTGASGYPGPPPAPPQQPIYPQPGYPPPTYPAPPGGYGPGRPYPSQLRTPRRKRSRGGCIIPVVVVAFIIIFNVVSGIGHVFNRGGSSSDGGSHYTPVPTYDIDNSVRQYYLAAGGGQVERAENYVCTKDRSAWRANAARAGVDRTRPVNDTSTTPPDKAGDGYDTTATVKLMNGTTSTHQLHLVKEDGLYRICGGLI